MVRGIGLAAFALLVAAMFVRPAGGLFALFGVIFERIGIDVLRRSETTRVLGEPAVTAAVLADGRTLDCDLLLTATGIRPNVDLARDAGIPVGRGVLVDDRMQTAAQTAVRHRLEVPSSALDSLRAGDWSPLHDIAAIAE